MRIQSTAPDRKTLVNALAEHLGEEAVYCGPPSFAYTIGGVTVDREGQVILPEDVDMTGIKSFLVSKGWLEEEPVVEPEEGLVAQVAIVALYQGELHRVAPFGGGQSAWREGA